MYDYGARNYDQSLGRFMTLDPLSEFYTEFTPYNYVGCNPIVRTNPKEMDWYTDKNEIIIINQNWQKKMLLRDLR